MMRLEARVGLAQAPTPVVHAVAQTTHGRPPVARGVPRTGCPAPVGRSPEAIVPAYCARMARELAEETWAGLASAAGHAWEPVALIVQEEEQQGSRQAEKKKACRELMALPVKAKACQVPTALTGFPTIEAPAASEHWAQEKAVDPVANFPRSEWNLKGCRG